MQSTTEAAAQLNEDIDYWLFKNNRRKLKQTFYHLIPLFQDKIEQCRSHISVLATTSQLAPGSITYCWCKIF